MYLNKEYWKKYSDETWPKEKELVADLKKRIKGLTDIVEIDQASFKSVSEIQALRAPVYEKYERQQFGEIKSDCQKVLEDAYEQLARAAFDCFNRYKLEEPLTAEQLLGWVEMNMDPEPEEKPIPTVHLICEILHPSVQPHIDILSKNPDYEHYSIELPITISTIAEMILLKRPASHDELMLKLSDLFEGYKIKGIYIYQVKDRNLDITAEAPRRQRLNTPQKNGFYGLMNDKVVQTISANKSFRIDDQYGKIFSVPIDRQSTTFASIGSLSDGITTAADISPADISITEAVANLMMENENWTFTDIEIWRRERGKDPSDNSNPGQKKLAEIRQRIRDLLFLKTVIDFSDELKNHHITVDDEKLASGRVITSFLKGSEIEFTTENGRTLSAFRFDERPILYEYNMLKKEVCLLPNDVISIRPKRNETDDTIPIQRYLARQIKWMKDKHGRKSNKILLSTMYDALNMDTPEERAAKQAQKRSKEVADPERTMQKAVSKFRKMDNEIIVAALDEWVKLGWIHGYTAEGRPVRAYAIDFEGRKNR